MHCASDRSDLQKGLMFVGGLFNKYIIGIVKKLLNNDDWAD